MQSVQPSANIAVESGREQQLKTLKPSQVEHQPSKKSGHDDNTENSVEDIVDAVLKHIKNYGSMSISIHMKKEE